MRLSFPRVFAWFGGHELAVLLAIGGIASGVWMLGLLANEVMAGVTQAFNWKLLLPIRRPGDHTPLGPPAIQEMAHDITALGGATVLGLLTASIADFLALDDKKANGFLDVGCVISGLITSTLLKALFNRPRPTLLPIPVCCRF